MKNGILRAITFVTLLLLFKTSIAQFSDLAISRIVATHYLLGAENDFKNNSNSSVATHINIETKPKVQPNQFTHSFVVSTTLYTEQTLRIQLLDKDSNLMRYKSLNGILGENRIEFNDLSALNPGIYTIRLITWDSVKEVKLIKL